MCLEHSVHANKDRHKAAASDVSVCSCVEGTTHVFTTSGSPINKPWKTLARWRTVNCANGSAHACVAKGQRVCATGYNNCRKLLH